MKAGARAWGWSWVGLVLAFVVHIADEVAGDALAFYNPLIRAVTSEELPFDLWITALGFLVVGLAASTVFPFRGVRAFTYPAYIVATLLLLNSLQHLVLLLALQRITPGTRSAPILLVAAVWVLRETRRVNRGRATEPRTSSR